MSDATLRLRLVTPEGAQEVEGIGSVCFDSDDGGRGVRPGHEQACVGVMPGLVVARAGRELDAAEQLFVTEGGLGFIDPTTVVIVTQWCARAPSVKGLASILHERAHSRRELERRARSVAEQHETAVRRTLVGLKREVTR